jgi:uncharacterized protein (TIGR02246 family)
MSGSMQANDEAAIRNVMSSYEGALNASDTAAVMPLYTEDGVFMPPYSQSAVGKATVRKAYDSVFKAITLNVKFTIAELVVMAPDWAFVRTNSAGTNKINKTGAVSPEGRSLQLFEHQSATGLIRRQLLGRRGERWQA